MQRAVLVMSRSTLEEPSQREATHGREGPQGAHTVHIGPQGDPHRTHADNIYICKYCIYTIYHTIPYYISECERPELGPVDLLQGKNRSGSTSICIHICIYTYVHCIYTIYHNIPYLYLSVSDQNQVPCWPVQDILSLVFVGASKGVSWLGLRVNP